MAIVPSATRNGTILVVKRIPIADFSIKKILFLAMAYFMSVQETDNGRERNDSYYWLDTLIMRTKARR